MKRFICLGVPYWIGERIKGHSAVDAIKARAATEIENALWVDVKPDFSVADDPVVAINRALAGTIIAHSDSIPIVFAGDCTSCLGMMKGLEQKSPAILWYDAHGDFNTPETTPGGFLGGMPLAALVGRGNEQLMQGLELAPVAERDVMITDARDLDPEEEVALRASEVLHLARIGELLTAPLPRKPLYLHFDLDVINTDEMPAVSYPAAGGPTVEQAAATLRRVAREADLAGVLFTLWNNSMDGADISMRSTLHLVRVLIESQQDIS